MTPAAPLACVLGEIELLRPLARAGIPCAAVSRPGDPIRYSRYVRSHVEWVDPWTRPTDLIDRLLEFARAQPEPPVLFYDGDWDLLLASRHRDVLREAMRFVVAEPGLVEDLVDKARFQDLARRKGLPVPAAVSVDPARTGPDGVDLRFPLVVKPLTRQHATWRPLAQTKAIAVGDRAELDALWPRLVAAELDVLVQEAVAGPESAIESYHVYIDSGDRIAAEFTGRKIRTYPTSFGYTTSLVITDQDDVASAGRAICRAIQLEGVAKLDFKRDPDGRLFLLEINPRFNLWHHPGAYAGVNIPAAVYADLAGLSRPPLGAAQPGVRWCNLVGDRRAAREAGMPMAQWLLWALRCETKSAFAWRDPAPALRAEWWRIRRRAMSGRTRTRSP